MKWEDDYTTLSTVSGSVNVNCCYQYHIFLTFSLGRSLFVIGFVCVTRCSSWVLNCQWVAGFEAGQQACTVLARRYLSGLGLQGHVLLAFSERTSFSPQIHCQSGRSRDNYRAGKTMWLI